MPQRYPDRTHSSPSLYLEIRSSCGAGILCTASPQLVGYLPFSFYSTWIIQELTGSPSHSLICRLYPPSFSANKAAVNLSAPTSLSHLGLLVHSDKSASSFAELGVFLTSRGSTEQPIIVVPLTTSSQVGILGHYQVISRVCDI